MAVIITLSWRLAGIVPKALHTRRHNPYQGLRWHLMTKKFNETRLTQDRIRMEILCSTFTHGEGSPAPHWGGTRSLGWTWGHPRRPRDQRCGSEPGPSEHPTGYQDTCVPYSAHTGSYCSLCIDVVQDLLWQVFPCLETQVRTYSFRVSFL